MRLFIEFLKDRPQLSALVSHRMKGPPEGAVGLLLDPSSCIEIITTGQLYGQVIYKEAHYFSWVWVHGVHALRMKLLKLCGFL